MRSVPTIEEYIDTEWDDGDGLPGPSYRRKYGIEPHSNCDHNRGVLDPIVPSKGNGSEVEALSR